MKSIWLVVLLLAILQTIEGSRCRGAYAEDKILNIYIIPHSHDDVGTLVIHQFKQSRMDLHDKSVL